MAFTVEYLYKLRDQFSGKARHMANEAQRVSSATRAAARSMHAMGIAAFRASKGFDRMITGMGHVRRAGRRMIMRQGGMLTGMGTGMSMLGVGRTLYGFEDNINHIKALTGASREGMGELRKEIIEIGGRSMYTATQVAEGSVELARAGVYSIEKQKRLLDGVVMLSEATSTPMNKAADIVTNITKSFGMKINKGTITEMVDALAHSARRTNFDILQLSESMKKAAPSAHAYGMSMKDTTAVMMLLAQRGVKSGIAGRGFARILNNSIGLTPKALKALKAIGINSKTWHDKDGNVKFFEMEKQFREAMEKHGKIKTFNASKLAFDSFGHRVMQSLLGAQVGELQGFRDIMAEADGAASSMRVARMEGLPGAWKYLVASIEKLILTIGEAGLIDDLIAVGNKIRAFAHDLAAMDKDTLKSIGRAFLMISAISALSLAFSSITMPIGMAIWSFGLIAQTISGLGLFISSFISSFSYGIASLGLALGPTVWLLSALAAAAYLVYDNWNNIVPFVKDVLARVGDIIKGVFNVIIGALEGDWERVKHGLWQIFDGLIKLFVTLVKGLVQAIIGTIRTVSDKLGSLGEGIKNKASEWWAAAGNWFNDLKASAYIDDPNRRAAAQTMTADNILRGAYGGAEPQKVDVTNELIYQGPQTITLQWPNGMMAGSIPMPVMKEASRGKTTPDAGRAAQD